MDAELLKLEYELAYTAYESFNDQLLAIKGWSVTIGLAGILASYSESLKGNGRVAVLAASASVIPFWVMDAQWKSYQTAYADIIGVFESGENWIAESPQLPSLFMDWKMAHNSGQWFAGSSWKWLAETNWSWVSHLYLPNVALPHVFILALGMYLAFHRPPKGRN